MAPKKRKVAAAGVQNETLVNPDHVAVLNKRLEEIDTAVEERCESIKAAADQAVAKIMQQLKMQLLQLPKKVRNMPYKEYLASQQQQQGNTDAGPSAAAAAVAASVDSKLEAAQQQSVAAATAAPTTRSLRSRARSATAVAAAEPRTTRSTRSRQAVPAAAPAELASAAAAPAQEATAGDAAPAQPAGQTQLKTLMAVDSPAQPAAAAAAAQASSAAAQKPAMGPPAAAADADARRAAALDRAQAKVDAKLAALGLAAGTAARGADRTVLRQANPGEACFSKNGSPLSIHPNVTRHRGRTGAAPLMTPAMQAAAPAGASMLGCITLIKKQQVATGAAAATGRSKRGRAATAGAAAAEQAGAAGEGTAIMVTTDDGSAFTVDAATGGVEGVPGQYREEVAAKLRAIQQLAAAALGGRA